MQWMVKRRRASLSTREVFEASEDDALLNPAHILVGTKARDKVQANAFVDWLKEKHQGQRIIGELTVDGVVLHSPVPEGGIGTRAM